MSVVRENLVFQLRHLEIAPCRNHFVITFRLKTRKVAVMVVGIVSIFGDVG